MTFVSFYSIQPFQHRPIQGKYECSKGNKELYKIRYVRLLSIKLAFIAERWMLQHEYNKQFRKRWSSQRNLLHNTRLVQNAKSFSTYVFLAVVVVILMPCHLWLQQNSFSFTSTPTSLAASIHFLFSFFWFSECIDRKGSASGSCAAGFGVCCVFLTSSCGSTVSENCTYIR